MAKRRGTIKAQPEQTVWPHLIVGFVLGAVGVQYLSGATGGAGLAGCVGAGLGYLLHCWTKPLAKCWWPTWFWLGWFGLRGCSNRAITSGKYYSEKPRCPLHPNSPHYRRVGARMLGRGKPKEKTK